MPATDPDQRTEVAPLAGDPPNPIDPPSGCRFRTRCWKATDVCATTTPAPAVDPDVIDHSALCHHPMLVEGSGLESVPA